MSATVGCQSNDLQLLPKHSKLIALETFNPVTLSARTFINALAVITARRYREGTKFNGEAVPTSRSRRRHVVALLARGSAGH
ncbi:hypothetical protein EVAR_103708_1 [Eumeta japonica]|uniref:Uncharacterized protein n=1 Tax=Eumeta variegata TaxID=151549 RepID=A0A4C1ZG71_EUMVA|nr:hypothetical protein EVAR_103708_1 [Eumeta japonica]